MKKQGFTLIELMVVIVIMGILAAVAVPKLFGMIAKSKASEVGPAAGTYVKLADVYYVENNAMGTWAQIGYNAPNGTGGSSAASTNFTYGASTFDATASGNATWGAYNNVALNDCGANSSDVWTVTPTFSSTSGAVSYNAAITADKVGTCGVLTPNFTKIGK